MTRPTPAQGTITPATRAGAIVPHDTGQRSHLALPPPALSVDLSSTTVAWSWSYPAFMRMSNPSCHGHKYIGGPLGPIGSEWRRASSPRHRACRWRDSRLFGPPVNPPCVVLDHIDLRVDILDSSIWGCDPLQAPSPGVRLPGSLPRPDEAPPTRNKKRGAYPVTFVK